MKTIKDDANNLTWFHFDKQDESQENSLLFYEFTEKLNYWETNEIRRFILGFYYPNQLGDFMKFDHLFSVQELFFGFQNDELAVATLINPDSTYKTLKKIKNYYSYCKDLKPDTTGYFSTEEALEVIRAKKSSASIDCIVVNPCLQAQGVGTRAIASIKQNLSSFTDIDNQVCLHALIHAQNIASEKAFGKNGFKPLYTDRFCERNRDQFALVKSPEL